jgi:hypothetical protein
MKKLLETIREIWFVAQHIYLTGQQRGWDPETIHDDNCGCDR